eukprot:20201-Ditylum_brightwellii.AAC.1
MMFSSSSRGWKEEEITENKQYKNAGQIERLFLTAILLKCSKNGRNYCLCTVFLPKSKEEQQCL